MKEYVEVSEEYRKIAERVIKKTKSLHFINDMQISIGYCVSDRAKTDAAGLVLAECKKVQPVYQAYIEHDFIIVVYEPNVQILDFDKERKEILMYHELLHIGVSDEGEMQYKVIPHDVQDFEAIINKYGLHWAKGGK